MVELQVGIGGRNVRQGRIFRQERRVELFVGLRERIGRVKGVIEHGA